MTGLRDFFAAGQLFKTEFTVNPGCADANPVLTFAELEATTCARLTRLFALDFASVAGEETGGLEGGTIGLFVYLAKCAGDSETNGLCLTFGSTTDEGNLNVKLTCCTGNLERLVYDVLEGSLLEVLFHRAIVDDDCTAAGCNINTSDC